MLLISYTTALINKKYKSKWELKNITLYFYSIYYTKSHHSYSHFYNLVKKNIKKLKRNKIQKISFVFL